MKALIFAAGLGTRLKPFTTTHPKALVPVAGKPMLAHVIEKIKRAGFSEIIINVHHFSDQIIEYLYQNDYFGVDIHISNETELLLETGGGIVRCIRKFDLASEPLLIHNSDILTDFSLASMSDVFEKSESDALLLVKDRNTTRKFLFDDDMRLYGWINRITGELRPPTLTNSGDFHERAFGGVHMISPKLIKEIVKYNDTLALQSGRQSDSTGATPFSVTDFYIARCTNLTITGFEPDDYSWFDVGRPEALEAAEQYMAAKNTTF